MHVCVIGGLAALGAPAVARETLGPVVPRCYACGLGTAHPVPQIGPAFLQGNASPPAPPHAVSETT